MEKLYIYKASAGSGKTHLLTGFYLQLAFENPENFSKILAVTFTNKAAEEMKERILEEIDAVFQKGRNASQFDEISRKLGLHEEEMRERALKIRDNILHNYSRFSVGTIDSFVQSVTRAFSFELGVNSTYNIELDTEKPIEDLISLLFAQIPENPRLKHWLATFARTRTDDGYNWNIRDSIRDLAGELFKEKFQHFKQAFALGEDDDSFYEILGDLEQKSSTVVRDFENRMSQLSDEAAKLLKRNPYGDLKPGRVFDSVVTYLTKYLKQKKYEPSSESVKKAIDGNLDDWYAKSASKEVIDFITDIYPEMSRILNQTAELRISKQVLYKTCKSILRNFYTFAILGDLARLLPEYRYENNILFISDANILLKKIISDNDAPFIYEKIGNRYKYVLIDEFQDTSGFQWANFKPLIQNSLSENNRNLIVGDIKQSIYRWRGGDFRLLLERARKDTGEIFVSEKSLDTNWRSKKNIIDFNNIIFEKSPKIVQNMLNDRDSFGEADFESDKFKSIGYETLIEQAYGDAYQLVSSKTGIEGGRVRIEFFGAEDELSFKETAANHAAETIDRLLKNKNYEPRDFCVLVRTNNEAKTVVNAILEFQQETGNSEKYDIISGESLYLSANAGIRMMISAMKFMSNADDLLSRACFLNDFRLSFPESIPQEINVFEHLRDLGVFRDILPDFFFENIDEIKKKSIYELSEYLISALKLNLKPEFFPYLAAFQDTVNDYSKRFPSDLQEFLAWWDLKGTKISLQMSEKQNAVKVMTMHKSKGLAFRNVILPFADWEFDHRAAFSPVLWATPDADFFDIRFPLPVKYSSELKNTLYNIDRLEERAGAALDALNVLYVAFTRPKEELIVFAKQKKERKNIVDVGDLLFEIVTNPANQSEENKKFINPSNFFNRDGQIFNLSVSYNEKDGEKFIREDIRGGISMTEYPSSDIAHRLKIQQDSDEFLIESDDAVRERVEYGSLMHAVFARIRTRNDIDSVLSDMSFAGYLSETEKQNIAGKVREIISRPGVAEWFDDAVEIFNEREIITKQGLLRIPDRVIIKDDEIIVIDFKFGEPKKEHREQILEYAALLREIYGKTPLALVYYAEKDEKHVFKIDSQMSLFE